jgi:hypothetical protein
MLPSEVPPVVPSVTDESPTPQEARRSGESRRSGKPLTTTPTVTGEEGGS